MSNLRETSNRFDLMMERFPVFESIAHLTGVVRDFTISIENESQARFSLQRTGRYVIPEFRWNCLCFKSCAPNEIGNSADCGLNSIL